jgi:hypothetical protein
MHEIARPDDTNLIKLYALKFLEVIIRITSTYPTIGASGAVLATAAIQSATWTNILMLTEYKNEEAIPTQMYYIMTLFAGMIVANSIQGVKLANYAKICHAQITSNSIDCPQMPVGCSAMTLKIFNTLANLSTNALSVMGVAQKFSQDDKHLMSATIAIGCIAFVMQGPAVGQFYGLYQLTERWSMLAAVLYALPDSLLYANAFLFDTTHLYICLFVLIALLVFPGIVCQYFGGDLLDKALKRTANTSELFTTQEDQLPLLPTPGATVETDHLLRKLGLNKNQFWVFSELITVGLKTAGVGMSIYRLDKTTLKWLQENLPINAADALDIVLMVLIGLLGGICYLSNSLIRNLLAVCGLNRRELR